MARIKKEPEPHPLTEAEEVKLKQELEETQQRWSLAMMRYKAPKTAEESQQSKKVMDEAARRLEYLRAYLEKGYDPKLERPVDYVPKVRAAPRFDKPITLREYAEQHELLEDD